MRGRTWGVCALITVGTIAAPNVARAGVPECDGIRIEADAQCELKLAGSCEGGCAIDNYTRVCATRQYEVCDQECTFLPEPTCTDACTETCDEQCSAGVEVVCHDNCFPECTIDCVDSCAVADDSVQCQASCEATCDAECDHQCAMLPPDANCYYHCVECCGGSCNAAANMDCQISCSEQSFEQCTVDMDVECHAACDLQGALYCDGQYIVGGSDLDACANALLARGIEILEQLGDELEQLGDDIEDEIEEHTDPFDADGDGIGGACACRADAPRPLAWSSFGLLTLGLWGLRRWG